jgi:hypothetical protein
MNAVPPRADATGLLVAASVNCPQASIEIEQQSEDLLAAQHSTSIHSTTRRIGRLTLIALAGQLGSRRCKAPCCCCCCADCLVVSEQVPVSRANVESSQCISCHQSSMGWGFNVQWFRLSCMWLNESVRRMIANRGSIGCTVRGYCTFPGPAKHA